MLSTELAMQWRPYPTTTCGVLDYPGDHLFIHSYLVRVARDLRCFIARSS